MTQIPPVISPNFREEIRNETYYLAAPTIRDEVVWRKIDGADTLVTRVSAEAETARPAEAESLLKPAFLTAVIQMTSNKFWMDAEGGWLGPIEYVEEFSQVKLAARVAAPPPQYAPFAQDFADALDNLKFMVDSVGTKGFVQKGVLDTVGGDRGFKIRHALFERRDDTRDNEEDEFPIKSWPVSSAHAKEGLEKIVDTHLLAGAVVYITFTLKHWAFMSHMHGLDTTVADVKHMRVLDYPPSSSPTREQPPPRDPGSPSKRMRKESDDAEDLKSESERSRIG